MSSAAVFKATLWIQSEGYIVQTLCGELGKSKQLLLVQQGWLTGCSHNTVAEGLVLHGRELEHHGPASGFTLLFFSHLLPTGAWGMYWLSSQCPSVATRVEFYGECFSSWQILAVFYSLWCKQSFYGYYVMLSQLRVRTELQI